MVPVSRKWNDNDLTELFSIIALGDLMEIFNLEYEKLSIATFLRILTLTVVSNICLDRQNLYYLTICLTLSEQRLQEIGS